MRKIRVQRQPQKRFPWGKALLVSAPPIGCGLAGAAICSKKGAEMTSAIVGRSEAPPEKQMGVASGAAAGLVLGVAFVHCMRWLKRR